MTDLVFPRRRVSKFEIASGRSLGLLSGRLFFIPSDHAGSGEAPAETPSPTPHPAAISIPLSTETIPDFILRLPPQLLRLYLGVGGDRAGNVAQVETAGLLGGVTPSALPGKEALLKIGGWADATSQ